MWFPDSIDRQKIAPIPIRCLKPLSLTSFSRNVHQQSRHGDLRFMVWLAFGWGKQS